MKREPFERVVERHGPTVLRVCRAVVGPVAAAEDAWSETFLAALQAYPDLAPDSNVEAWLVTIAHRKAVNQLRHFSRRPGPLPLPADGNDPPERPAAVNEVAFAHILAVGPGDERPHRPACPEPSDNSDHPGHPGRSDLAGWSGHPAPATNPERAGQASHADRPDHTGHLDRTDSDHAVHAGRSDRSGRPSGRAASPVDPSRLSRAADLAAPHQDNALDPWPAVLALPLRQRQAVAYHHVAGLPYTEVAAVLGCSVVAARRAASDGIASLRIILQQQETS
ncbi:RNA polymerase sigma factor [Kineosporia babensis]|uniref:RNA polymerase sigma factor n=1 Tax=Kineosporia babensis TaxID=499548 RepID=UPI0038B279BC